MKIRHAIWNWGTVAQRRQILFEAIDSYFKNCDFVPDKNIVDSFLNQFNLEHVHEPVIRGIISGFISCEISIIDPHTIGGRFFNYVMNGCDGREDYPDRRCDLFIGSKNMKIVVYSGELISKLPIK